ncbi:MAG: peptidoglycan-binding protein [Candidatus Omnitrophica bacterium]|nr:peptidoglycan-binding protein [Candidatus Omnitrophota bacterium]
MYRTPSGFEIPALSLQEALKNAGYYKGTLDGKIGSGTREAIKNFQRDNGLKVDGVCGRNTWERLKVYLRGSIK